MKKINYPIFALLLTVSFVLPGCALFPDKDDKCLKDNWKTAQDPIIYVRMTSGVTSFQDDVLTYELAAASTITLKGSITKVYCTGEISGSFDIDAQLFPNSGAIPLNLVKIGGPYQFKFQNDDDRVEVRCKMRATFANGTVFETKDLWDQFAFQNIKYDVNAIEKYVLITFPVGTSFTKVTK